jgi:predicted metal-dependent hydrolase
MNWCGDSQFFTRNCDAVSTLFPAWERAFVAVAKHYLPEVKDEELRGRIEQFIREELAHASAHEAYNARAGMTDLANEEYRKTRIIHRRPGAKLWLGSMVSIEHFAACMGRMYLDLYGDKAGRDHSLFAWHSREEIGHKDLAMDLWRSLGHSDADLRAIARQNQGYVIKFIVGHTLRGSSFRRLKDWTDFAHWAWHMTTKVFVPMLKIYLPNFHPSKVDDRRYLEVSA